MAALRRQKKHQIARHSGRYYRNPCPLPGGHDNDIYDDKVELNFWHLQQFFHHFIAKFDGANHAYATAGLG